MADARNNVPDLSTDQQSVTDGQQLLKKINADSLDIDKYGQVQEKYFTAAQTRMFINSSLVDEFTSVRFVAKTEDGPAYSYNAKFFNTLIEGKFSVMGSFSINFTKAGYIMELLNKDGITRDQAVIKEVERRAPAANDQYVQREKMTRKQLTDAIWGSNSTLTEAQQIDPNSLDAMKKKLFTITLTYGDPNDPFGRTTVHRISVCKIISVEQQVMVNDGNCIQEVYNFIARAIDDPNDIVTGKSDYLFIPKLPVPTATAQKNIVLEVMNMLGRRIYTYLTDPDNLSFDATPLAPDGYLKDTSVLFIDHSDKYQYTDIATLEAAAATDPTIAYAYQKGAFDTTYTPYKDTYKKMFTGLGNIDDAEIKKFSKVIAKNTNGFLFKIQQSLVKGNSSYAKTDTSTIEQNLKPVLDAVALVEQKANDGDTAWQKTLTNMADSLLFLDDPAWLMDDFVQHDVQTLANGVMVIGGFDFKTLPTYFQVNIATVDFWYPIDSNFYRLCRSIMTKFPTTKFENLIGAFVVKDGTAATLIEGVDYSIDRHRGYIKAITMPAGGLFSVQTPTLFTAGDTYTKVLPESDIEFDILDMKVATESPAIREVIRTKRNLMTNLSLNSSKLIAIDLDNRKIGYRPAFQTFVNQYIPTAPPEKVRTLHESSLQGTSGTEYANMLFLDPLKLEGTDGVAKINQDIPFPAVDTIPDLKILDAESEKDGISSWIGTDLVTALETYTVDNTLYVSIMVKPSNIYMVDGRSLYAQLYDPNTNVFSNLAFNNAVKNGTIQFVPFMVPADVANKGQLADPACTMLVITSAGKTIATKDCGQIKSIKLLTDAIGGPDGDKYIYAIEFNNSDLQIPKPGTLADGSAVQIFVRALPDWALILGSTRGSTKSKLRYITDSADPVKSKALNQSVYMFINNETKQLSQVVDNEVIRAIVPKIGFYMSGAGFLIDYASYIRRLSDQLVPYFTTGEHPVNITKKDIQDAIYSGYKQIQNETTISSNRSNIPNTYDDADGMAAAYRFFSPPLTSDLEKLVDSSVDPTPNNKTSKNTFIKVTNENGFHILKTNVPFEPTVIGRVLVKRPTDFVQDGTIPGCFFQLHGIQTVPDGYLAATQNVPVSASQIIEVVQNAGGNDTLRWKDALHMWKGYGQMAVFQDIVRGVVAVKQVVKFTGASGADERKLAGSMIDDIYGVTSPSTVDPNDSRIMLRNRFDAFVGMTFQVLR